MKKRETLRELWRFALQRKTLLLAPLVLLIILLGLLFFFTAATPVAPFVYTLF